MEKTQLSSQNKTRICKLRVQHKTTTVVTEWLYTNKMTVSDSGIKTTEFLNGCPSKQKRILKNIVEVKEAQCLNLRGFPVLFTKFSSSLCETVGVRAWVLLLASVKTTLMAVRNPGVVCSTNMFVSFSYKVLHSLCLCLVCNYTSET